MTVVYPYDADKPFDEAYYADHHMPLVKEIWGEAVTGTTVYHALAGLSGDLAFSTIAQVEFVSMEAFQKAMANPRSAEVNADIPNFCGVTPTFQLSRRA
ncbi:EthD family reductase [Sphingomonas sp. Mn802worker]|uniref:EthD family reductase n=1 Tax=Sphingomonas sp. Mn802worker TaxID=629773 RepID=UPI001EE6DF2C|nr:EthD family reductase [Sphingomonas sp. Mn802worker]